MVSRFLWRCRAAFVGARAGLARSRVRASLGTLACLALCACNNDDTGPGGVYVTPEFQDLGVVTSQDEAVIARFQVVDRLTSPVRITNVFPSCQCTSAVMSKNPIPAGEVAVMEARAKLTGVSGQQSFSVALETDNPSFPRRMVRFHACRWKKVRGDLEVVSGRRVRQRHFWRWAYTTRTNTDPLQNPGQQPCPLNGSPHYQNCRESESYVRVTLGCTGNGTSGVIASGDCPIPGDQ
ncbi:DUF1573 domain-containing protein [Maioricimonas sp. JC845]|uniref:DUF1573 domain-containing protein n=1 Tax=Maioricimonas sp. JC845 TaxID=3232138 RepID=UPI00345A2270